MLASKVVLRSAGSALKNQQQHYPLLAVNSLRPSKSVLKPMQAYEKRIAQQQLLPDVDQKATVNLLEKLYNTLEYYSPGFLGQFIKIGQPSDSSIQLSNTASPKGLYIYGGSGAGKTTLMDLFYDCCTNIDKKQRIHFNSFMSQVHAKIHQVKKGSHHRDRFLNMEKFEQFDPTLPVAEKIAAKSWLICLDDFHVTDIADAVILTNLFTHLFNQGIVCVATSNRHPTDLYENGLQRTNFLPFIDMLLNRCNLSALNSGINYRRHIAQPGHTNYFVRSQTDSTTQMDHMLEILCSKENDIIRPRTFNFFKRYVTFQRACGHVLDSSFEELCNRYLDDNDYLQVGQIFHTILIRDVPQLTTEIEWQMSRFISLIDTLYDNRVRVVISAEVPIDKLFNYSSKSTNNADDQRTLMNTLKLNLNNTSASVFTDGEEGKQFFERTISRLHEMQKKEYLKQWANKHL